MSKRDRKVCFVVGPNDYRQLYRVLQFSDVSETVFMQIVTVGAAERLRKDGLAVDTEISADRADGVRYAAAVMVGLADAFRNLKPFLVVVVGSSVEALAAATAAQDLRIPVAHIGGGEGNPIGDSITKLSHLHFTAAEIHAERIVQMGENPSHVFAYGAPSLDRLVHDVLPTRDEVAAHLKISPDQRFFLLAHSEPCDEVRAALANFPDFATASLTGDDVFDMGLVKEAAAVIGNSSLGLVEAPAAGTPTVNIGLRQHGRSRSASVFDCGDDRIAIEDTIRRALQASELQMPQMQKPAYGRPGDCSQKIFIKLRLFDLAGLFDKRFHDAGAGFGEYVR